MATSHMLALLAANIPLADISLRGWFVDTTTDSWGWLLQFWQDDTLLSLELLAQTAEPCAELAEIDQAIRYIRVLLAIYAQRLVQQGAHRRQAEGK